MNDFTDMRQKIDKARRQLPLPALMASEGLGEHAKKSAHCPFHDDQHKSFSVFEGKDGFWYWKCHAGCGDGDEIMFLRKLRSWSLTDAMTVYLDMAGFPPCVPHKSREYPELPDSPKCPESLSVLVSESPCVSVFPMSEGQGLDKELEKELKALAARNACTRAENKADKKSFEVARGVKALDKKMGRRLTTVERLSVFGEWYRLSQKFLDPAKTRDDYLTDFLAQVAKVRVPTGEGETKQKALEAVSKLALSELPMIPEMPNAPESWRRVLAYHRELSRLSGGNKYFLSYRDAAKVYSGLTPPKAHNITLALVTVGVIEIVRKGKAGLNSRQAAEFRYLLPEPESAEADDD
jgi:hypothetical protein